MYIQPVFLDQFGEQTYLCYGTSKDGLVGKSLSSDQVSEWILAHHLGNILSLIMDNAYEEPTKDHNLKNSSHKDNTDSRRSWMLNIETRSSRNFKSIQVEYVQSQTNDF